MRQWTVEVFLTLFSLHAHEVTEPTDPPSFLRGRTGARFSSDLHIFGELTLH